MLREEGHQVIYTFLQPGQRSYALLRDREVDVMQSAVSSNWSPLEQGIELLPVHFAQINQRAGFLSSVASQSPHSSGRTSRARHCLPTTVSSPL
jgi:hypothetical protein